MVDSVWFCSALLRSALCCAVRDQSMPLMNSRSLMALMQLCACTSKAEQPAAVYPLRALILFDYYFKQESKLNSTNIKYRMPVAVIAANKMNAEKLLYHGITAYIYTYKTWLNNKPSELLHCTVMRYLDQSSFFHCIPLRFAKWILCIYIAKKKETQQPRSKEIKTKFQSIKNRIVQNFDRNEMAFGWRFHCNVFTLYW